jgi:hypothetical protein
MVVTATSVVGASCRLVIGYYLGRDAKHGIASSDWRDDPE